MRPCKVYKYSIASNCRSFNHCFNFDKSSIILYSISSAHLDFIKVLKYLKRKKKNLLILLYFYCLLPENFLLSIFLYLYPPLLFIFSYYFFDCLIICYYPPLFFSVIFVLCFMQQIFEKRKSTTNKKKKIKKKLKDFVHCRLLSKLCLDVFILKDCVIFVSTWNNCGVFLHLTMCLRNFPFIY